MSSSVTVCDGLQCRRVCLVTCLFSVMYEEALCMICMYSLCVCVCSRAHAINREHVCVWWGELASDWMRERDKGVRVLSLEVGDSGCDYMELKLWDTGWAQLPSLNSEPIPGGPKGWQWDCWSRKPEEGIYRNKMG